MTTLNGSLRLRSTRIGFLVAPTNMPEVRRIMQVCSSLWGGAYNPIIPVCDELPDKWLQPPFRNPTAEELAKGYLNFFEPDVLVESEPGLAARAGIRDGGLNYGKSRIVSLGSFFESGQGNQPRIPFGLNIFDLYQDLYDREFKFVRRHDHRAVLFESGTSHDAFVEAAFGGFPIEGLLSSLAQAYGEAFDPLRLTPSSENWTKVIKEGCATPLFFTAHGIKRDHDGYSEPTLFLVDPKSSIDLIDLWNLRQFTPHVLPVNVDWVGEGRDFIRDFITSNYRPLPGNPHGVMIRTTVQFGRSFSEAYAKEIVREILDGLPQGSWSFKLWYDRIWHVNRVEDRIARPRRVRLSATVSDLELAVSTEQKEKSIRFQSLAPEFASSYGDGKARWVNVLRLHTYANDESIAVVLPLDLGERALMRSRLGIDGAMVSREGLLLPQHFKKHGEYLRSLSGTKVIVEWLAERGIAAKPSDAGRIADQVLNSIGGFWGAYLLAHRETLETLDNMAKSVRRYSDGKIEEYPDRAKPAKFWQSLLGRRNKQKQWSDVTLDAFVKAGVLRLGLSVDCPTCMNHNWYGLHDIDEHVVCTRCLKSFDFPQGTLHFSHTPWQYRVVGPFSVPNFAAGAYGTVLALRVFSRNLGSDAQLTYCTGLEVTLEGQPNEVDFAFWYRRDRLFDHDEEPLLAFGESKSLAMESFKDKDVLRMERLARVFPGAFLVFATLKDSLSDDERSAIGKLALWGREHLTDGRPRNPVIVLTAMEMLADWHIKQVWENTGGRHKQLGSPAYVRLDNLWDFADLTQQLYLDLPDRYAHLRQPLPATERTTSGPPD
jgi:hypothetical protein